MTGEDLKTRARRAAGRAKRRLRRSQDTRERLARVESTLGKSRKQSKPDPSIASRLDKLERDVAKLAKTEVPALKDGLTEQRGLANRVSELADVVTELLVLAAQRDDPEFARVVAKFRKGL